MSAEILLIDDDPLIRTVVSDNLSDSGFLVHCAASEGQGLDYLNDNPDIRLAIIDYCLPKPVGIDLCRQIRASHPDVAVALYTGHGELAGVRLGGDDIPVLAKTMRHEKLVDAINDLLDGQRPQMAGDAMASRVEVLWRQELKRETVSSVGRAMHSQFDPTLKEPLPQPLSDTVMRLFRMRG